MKPARFFASLATVFAFAQTMTAAADAPAAVVPPNGATATFRFTTAVHTPKGSHSGSGTITIVHTQGRSLRVTVHSDDGKTKTLMLAVRDDGTVGPDPSAPAPAATDAPDAATRAFIGDASIAAHVGVAARKNAPSSTFTVPVTVAPIGEGTPVQTQMRMSAGSAASGMQYAGSVSAQTTTKLPQNGGLDPATLAKTVGVGTVAHFALGPAGRIATAIAMHHRKEQEKKAAAGELPDAVTLNVTTHLANGRFHDVMGSQTDALKIAKKAVTIHSEWTFTKVP